MAPEMLNGMCLFFLNVTSLSKSLSISFLFQGNAYDERVDIFSFGIIVCEVDHLCQM
jgi:hypothetical protein